MDKIDDIKNINKIDLLKKVTKDATEKFVEGLSLAFTDQTFRNAEIKDGKFSIDYDLDAMKDTGIRNTILLKGVEFMQLGKFKLQNTNTGIYTRARYSGASKYIKSEHMDDVLKVSMEQGFYLADVVIQYINSDNEQSQDTIDSSEQTKDVSITDKTDEKDVKTSEQTVSENIKSDEKTTNENVKKNQFNNN